MRVPVTATVTVALGNAFLWDGALREGGPGRRAVRRGLSGSRPRSSRTCNNQMRDRTEEREPDTSPWPQSLGPTLRLGPRPRLAQPRPRAPSGGGIIFAFEGYLFWWCPLLWSGQRKTRARVEGGVDAGEARACKRFFPPLAGMGDRAARLRVASGGLHKRSPGDCALAERDSYSPGWVRTWQTGRSACDYPTQAPRT